MKIKLKTSDQLELTLNSAARCVPKDRRQQRRQRAAAWFDHMRQVVERAIDWTPAPAGRPEQIWFPGAAQTVGHGLRRRQHQLAE